MNNLGQIRKLSIIYSGFCCLFGVCLYIISFVTVNTNMAFLFPFSIIIIPYSYLVYFRVDKNTDINDNIKKIVIYFNYLSRMWLVISFCIFIYFNTEIAVYRFLLSLLLYLSCVVCSSYIIGTTNARCLRFKIDFSSQRGRS